MKVFSGSADAMAGEASVDDRNLEVSVVLPCLNEAETVGTCVTTAIRTLQRLGIPGEVVVVDNGSDDGSPEIASTAGARVIAEPRRGYGNALRRGAEEARAPLIVMADSDDSYDLSDLGRFRRTSCARGADLVVGSRRMGRIEPGAMPWLNHRIGNPLLSGILNLFFSGQVSDAHCGMRALTKDAYRKMKVSAPGMEFASEMVIKAALANMRVVNLPNHPAARWTQLPRTASAAAARRMAPSALHVANVPDLAVSGSGHDFRAAWNYPAGRPRRRTGIGRGPHL